MGLEDFNTGSKSGYKKYGYHEYNSKLEAWVDELQERFPIDLNIEFIEVSPQMNRTWGMAYKRGPSTFYIRMSEDFINGWSDEEVKITVLHEMVHVYFYQMRFDGTNHDKYYRWVAGRVGAGMTNCSTKTKKWQECIEPFLEMEDSWD